MESGMIGIPIKSPTTIRTRTALAGARTLRARAPDSPSPPSPRLDAIERGIPMSTLARSRLASAAAALLVALPALIVLVLGDAPPAHAQKKKVLNIAAKEPDTLDPHTSVLGQTQAIVRFMYRGLTRFAIKDGKVTTSEVEPDLAESWSMSADGTIWTFKLRKGVQFHKGFGEMTAEDVKFSFDRQLQRAAGTRFAEAIEVVKSIEAGEPDT